MAHSLLNIRLSFLLVASFVSIRLCQNLSQQTNGILIEGKGISPDIPVKINSYADLVPFKDKILSTALRLAKEKR